MNAALTTLEVIHQRPIRLTPTSEELLVQVENNMHALVAQAEHDLTCEMAASQLNSGGKRVRARLAIHACSCFNVQPKAAVAWASAVEILHNATLVHDDVQDGDTMRRGQATVWAQYGLAQAINAGDYLLMLPFLALREVPETFQGTLSLLVADCCTRIVRGQVNEIDLNQQKHVELCAFLAACEGKTGALLALPVVGAAVLGGLTLPRAERLAGPFVQLGVLFQLQDDVVDLFGEKGRAGHGSDVHEGKVGALVVALLERRPDLRDQVLSVLTKPRHTTSNADVERMRTLYLESGALSDVLDRICALRSEVLNSALLRDEPRLYQLAERLCQLALAPIAHLLTEEF